MAKQQLSIEGHEIRSYQKGGWYYMNIQDIAKWMEIYSGEDQSFLFRNWIRNRNTLEFIREFYSTLLKS